MAKAQFNGPPTPEEFQRQLTEFMKQHFQQAGTTAPTKAETEISGDAGQGDEKDDEDFKSEASQTQNPALKQVAQQGGQVIDQHLQMIEQIAKSHNLMNDKGKLVSGD